MKNIKPAKVIYKLDDIFNALSVEQAGLEQAVNHGNAHKVAGAELAMSIKTGLLGSANAALAQLAKWQDEGVELLETPKPFSDGNVVFCDPNDALYTQIRSGTLKPSDPAL